MTPTPHATKEVLVFYFASSPNNNDVSVPPISQRLPAMRKLFPSFCKDTDGGKGRKGNYDHFSSLILRNLSGNAPVISTNAPKKMRMSFDGDIGTFLLKKTP